MGQKINPIALRLGHYRSRDSLWYSDLYYKKCLSLNLSLAKYYNQFLKHFKIPEARLGLQYGINQLRLFSFIYKKKKYSKLNTPKFSNSSLRYRKNINRINHSEPSTLIDYLVKKDKITTLQHNTIINNDLNTNLNGIMNRIKKKNIQNHLETVISNNSNLQVKLSPFVVKNYWQSASFLADEIVYSLEKRMRFTRIKNRLLKQITSYPWIKGIRIICSGRISGKSKQANQEYVKFGETPLHSFNRKIDFSSKTAHTAYGSLGIKVWVCYK